VFAIGIAAPNIYSGYENMRGFSAVLLVSKLAQPEHLFKTKTFVVRCKSRNHGAQFRKNGCVIFTAFAIEQFWQ